MANKLKNLHLTSVDLVRNGANQEADICLYKSADPVEATEQPTEAETNILKRFINWLRENPEEDQEEPTDPIEKDYTTFDQINSNRENSDKLWRYTDALTCSIRSIQEDHDLDKDAKLQMMKQSLGEFNAAMEELCEALCKATLPKEGTLMAKAGPEEEEDEEDEEVEEQEDDLEIEEVEKFNPYHDSRGRFAAAGSAASFTYSPGKSKAHDNAIARAKEGQAAAGGGAIKPTLTASPTSTKGKLVDQGGGQLYGENDNGYSASVLDGGKSDINFYRYGSKQIYEVSYNSDTKVGVKPKSYVPSKSEAKKLAQGWLNETKSLDVGKSADIDEIDEV